MSRSSKLKLFGGASMIAFGVALAGTAQASPAIMQHFAPAIRAGSPTTEALYVGDPLVELTLRSGGRVTAESVAALLPALVGPLTAESAGSLPALMEGIRGLGVARDIEVAAMHSLTGLIADAAGATLNQTTAARLMTEVTERFAATLQLAAVQNNPGTGNASDLGKSHNHNNGRGNGTYSG